MEKGQSEDRGYVVTLRIAEQAEDTVAVAPDAIRDEPLRLHQNVIDHLADLLVADAAVRCEEAPE